MNNDYLDELRIDIEKTKRDLKNIEAINILLFWTALMAAIGGAFSMAWVHAGIYGVAGVALIIAGYYAAFKIIRARLP